MGKASFNTKVNIILFLIITFLFIGSVVVNYVRFYQQKDFTMTLEDVCDPNTESCFYRDCSEEECPPNNIEIYKYVDVPAFFFEKCSDNTCHNECLSQPDSCEFTYCDPEGEEDVCFVLEPNYDEEVATE